MSDSPQQPWQALTSPNEAVINQVEKLLRRGLPLATCARYIATTETRLKRWLERGENAVETNSDEVEDRIYMQLFITAARAHAYYESEQIASLSDPENALWRRALSVLERRDARTWGKIVDDSAEQGEIIDPDSKFI
jgi:hypothetical protein